MQGMMIFESPIICLGFANIMKAEFDVDIDYTDRAAVLRAAQALVQMCIRDRYITGGQDGGRYFAGKGSF